MTEPQYPAKSISSSAAHIRFVLFRIAGKITTIHDIRQSQESGISKVHSLNRQSVGYYSTRSETAILDYDEKYRNLPYVGVLKPFVYGGK